MSCFSQCQWNANATQPFPSKQLSSLTHHQPLSNAVLLIQPLETDNACAILILKPIPPIKFSQSPRLWSAMNIVPLTLLLILRAYALVRPELTRPMGCSQHKWIHQALSLSVSAIQLKATSPPLRSSSTFLAKKRKLTPIPPCNFQQT